MLEIYFIIITLIFVFLGDFTLLGVSHDYLWKCVCYPLAHVNILHLLVNILSLSMIARPIWGLYNYRFGHVYFSKFFLYCYFGAVLAGFIGAQSIPTVGSSGISFFLLGALLGLRPTLSQLKALWTVFLFTLLQIYIGHSNVVLHISAFILGVVFIFVRQAYESTRIR